MTTDDVIFKKIADALRKDLPENWMKACLQIELEEHSGRSACFYQSTTEPAYQHVDIQVDVINLFKELHKNMMLRQSQSWNGATYILNPDGHFDIYFEYQDFAVSNVLDRRKAWRQKFIFIT